MSRTLPATVTSAIASTATAPVYLIQMALNSPFYRATWDTNITWGGQTWLASGFEVANITNSGAQITIPNGDNELWRKWIMEQGIRGREILIYEHHTDSTASPQTDAVLIFRGIMDEARLGDDITITAIDESQAKSFPPGSVDESVFSYLLAPGDRITWGPFELVVN